MFSLITAQSHKWGCGGTADTPVLGTGFFGSEGSNPFAPTRCNNWLNCCPSSKLHGNGSCTGSCTCCISSVLEDKNGRDSRDFVQDISLRKFCTPSIIFTNAYNTAITTCFNQYNIYSVLHKSCNTMQLN